MSNLDDVWAVDSPVRLVLGEAIAYKYDFADVGANDPSAVISDAIYDADGADKSSTLLSGSTSLSTSVVTGRKFTPAAAGTYLYRVSVTIDGNTVFGFCEFNVWDPSVWRG